MGEKRKRRFKNGAVISVPFSYDEYKKFLQCYDSVDRSKYCNEFGYISPAVWIRGIVRERMQEIEKNGLKPLSTESETLYKSKIKYCRVKNNKDTKIRNKGKKFKLNSDFLKVKIIRRR